MTMKFMRSTCSKSNLVSKRQEDVFNKTVCMGSIPGVLVIAQPVEIFGHNGNAELYKS